ncbi:MAG: Rieske (2Fe-2S) protein [Pseudomonadota bacterium]
MATTTSPTGAKGAATAGPDWYLVAPSAHVKPGQQIRRLLHGKPVLVGRTLERQLFAMRDICPHRLVPLSAGRQVKTAGEMTVECPYHGWRFGTDGVCRLIPSLMEDDPYTASDFKVAAYDAVEASGALFVREARSAQVQKLEDFAGISPPDLWVSGPVTAECDLPHLQDEIWLRLGWRSSGDGAHFEAADAPARHLFRAPARRETIAESGGWTAQRLTGPRGSLTLLVALTPETDTTTKAHIAIWWQGSAWFTPVSGAFRRTAERYLAEKT